jgi:hypothetical protein
MNTNESLNTQDILDSIDINMINMNDKKKRGRPKKNNNIINTNLTKIKLDNPSNNYEQEEIILHLPLTKNDIINLKEGEVNISEIDNDVEESISPNEQNEISNKHFNLIIKKLKEENDELKKFLTEITPMYFTEVKMYPVNLKLFDKNNEQFVPKKTNICCWWCAHPFDCYPTFIPDKFYEGNFYVYGCFCSFNCAGAYNLNLNDSKVLERYSLLKQLYYYINKTNITSIKDIEINIAGPRELLEKFGGTMKIDDYRKNSKIMGREYHKLMPPFIPLNFCFEETTNSLKNNKMININNILNNSSIRNEVLMKRNKPLNNIASKEIDNYIE